MVALKQLAVERAGRRYVAGPAPEDAVRVARGFPASTIGFWNASGAAPSHVAETTERTLELLAGEELDCYLSLKAPAFAYDRALVEEVLARVGRAHLDAQEPETAEPTFALIEALDHPGLSCTLPGRWPRSVRDADRAVELGLGIRVIKGQWADLGHPVDPTEGFLAVVDRLAGRARHVAVSTHDAPLATEALRRLREAGTPCQREVLLGLPPRPELGPARTYVPFGRSYLPYPRRRLGRLIRDLV